MTGYTPTAKGYFSGAGGMEIGIMNAGVKVIQSLDLDADAIACMKMNDHYFNHEILHVDITQITVLDQPKTDIHLFTWPCTKYSAIADIHGTRTGDDLFLHGFRHIVLEQPEMFIIENVPGMRKFKVVMEAVTELPNYYVTVVCPVDAKNWLPQKRERLIVFGTRKPFTICEPSVSHSPVRLKNIIESDPEVEIPDYVLSRLNGKYRDKPIIVDPEVVNALAPTCVAHYAKDLGTRLVKDRKSKHGIRPFTIREYARLQGFPDDYRFENKRSSYKLIGNAVAIHVGQWAGEIAMQYFN
jgi:DNA (cytosine-5)-methyltransferase 1